MFNVPIGDVDASAVHGPFTEDADSQAYVMPNKYSSGLTDKLKFEFAHAIGADIVPVAGAPEHAAGEDNLICGKDVPLEDAVGGADGLGLVPSL
jgi:hypothetical protein